MAKLPKVSEQLHEMLATFEANRDNEVSMLAEVLPQYVTDHNDRDAYRRIDRQVNALSRALDKMIKLLATARDKAEAIESSVDSFYGD